MDPDLAAVVRILRELHITIGHYQPDGTAWVWVDGSATVSAEDARILERVIG